jgi:hypothetical protein
MNGEQHISSKLLSGIRSDGVRLDITVAVGAPYKDGDLDSWACPLKVEGLLNNLADMHGMDSSQAFRRARKFVVWLLHDFLDKGGRIYLFDGDKAMTKERISALFEQPHRLKRRALPRRNH